MTISDGMVIDLFLLISRPSPMELSLISIYLYQWPSPMEWSLISLC